MTQITNEGFKRTRLDERIEELKSHARDIFGYDIDLSEDTMDGQHLAIFGEATARLDELAEAVWTSFDPDLATGHSLSRLVKINGIERSQGARSIVILRLTGAPDTFIPEGSEVSNKSGTVTVTTTDSVRINSDGVAETTATTDIMGAITAGADTLTNIKTPIFGWEAVTNPAPMIAGKVEETDRDLRLRRRGSVSRGNRNMREALWASLSDLDGVLEVSVLENATPATDKRGLPPFSTHVVILGGDDHEIAKTIWHNKTGGSPLAGANQVIIQDQMGDDQIIRFSRPTITSVVIRVYVRPIDGYVFNTQNLIRQRLASWVSANQKVGDGLINSQLYTPLNDIGGFEITSIEIARKGDEPTEQSLQVSYYERVTVDEADVEVLQS